MEIDPLGAQLHSLRGAGRDLLWHGDPAIWAGRAPILFPIVGTLQDGTFGFRDRRYALARHGFARTSPFAIISHTGESATFRLRSSEKTLAAYPFAFRLDIGYRLEGATLAVDATVTNEGQEPMPASLGFHPGFLWPLSAAAPREEHYIEFECEEP